ncbi:hypothetical protein Y1Q_0010746 [Alligator mississippiensis]|uniref:Uncharacterized protein n=1 Tax=Alligator mississippiensis TaxID=8496 RepID=A0A151M6T7_ALLMI|nr:hypothetical protein Y1Q_0010746 [Alligator mississippiensis]
MGNAESVLLGTTIRVGSGSHSAAVLLTLSEILCIALPLFPICHCYARKTQGSRSSAEDPYVNINGQS